MNRRHLLQAAAPVALLAFTTGCANNSATTPPQIVTDVQNAVSALAGSFSTVLQQVPNAVPPATAATITSALAQASSVLGSLSSSLSATASAPVVQKVEQAINTVISAAASVPLIPPPFSLALGAAAVVLPVIEAWVNSVLPAAAGVSGAALAARAKLAAPMSVADAEKTLAQMAGR